MALVLSIRRDTEEYVRIEHAGESMRIAVRTSSSQNRTTLIFVADDDSGQSPPPSWRIVRSTAVKKT